MQQLCDAGEDEFLEIMALVGMASKPLHVRRFQKALAEWVSSPASFKVPLSSIGEFYISIELRKILEIFQIKTNFVSFHTFYQKFKKNLNLIFFVSK